MTTDLEPALENEGLAFLRGGGAMGELMRSRDWQHSELGAPERWPAALKSAISSALNSGTAMHISWGENLLQFYNDAYTPVLTDGKHPAALGSSVRESFPEIWDFIQPLFDRVVHQGEAIAMENAPLMMYRDGILKESFFSFSYSPLRSLSGDICGVVAVCWETTEEVVIKQRERGLRLLSEQLVAATTNEEVRDAVHRHVDGDRGGVPFLLWFDRDEALQTLQLVKSCGISPDAPLVQALATQDGRSTLGRALDSSVPVAVQLPLVEPVGSWLLNRPPAMEINAIAVEPLCYVNYSIPDAYLVFGVSSQRPFDGALKNFYDSICRGIERAVRRIRAVELQQRESQRQFDTVMRLTLDAAHIGYWDLDLLTGVPKRSLLHDRIFGYDEPLAVWNYEIFLEHVLPQDREPVDRKFKAGLAAKAGWDIECRIIRRDGALRWIWIHGDVLTDPAGDAIRTRGIVIDITDRKKSDEAMRESERRFATAFEHAPIGKALVALDGRYLKVNRALCDFLGYSEPELLASCFQSITHRDDVDPGLAHVRRLLSGETSTYQTEKRYIHSSGLVLPALLTASVVRDDDGGPLYVIAQIQDISERKAAEHAIERAMQRLNEAQRVGKIGDWEYVPASEYITWSPQLFEIFGRDPRLGPPRDYAENATLFDAANRAHQHVQFQRTMESGQPQDYELIAHRPDGTLVPIHVLAVPHCDDSGKVVRIHGTIQDISVRKQAEAEALKAASRLTTTLDSMSDAFFTLDREWRFTFLNSQAEQILGRGREELLGRQVWAEFPSGVGSQFESEYRRAVADNVTVAFEEYFELLHIYLSVRAYPSEHGLAVYFTDVTESRRAAASLRASEAEFRTLAESMPQIVWTTRADGWNTFFNQQWSDYTGLSLEEGLGHGWIQPFHPEERDRAVAAWQHATETGGTYSIESRLRRADGEYRWWLVRGVPLKDSHGHVIKWFGTCTDIHDLKVADESLRRNEARLRTILEAEPECVKVVSTDGRVLSMNAAGLRMIQAQTFGQIAGRPVRDLLHPDDWQAFQDLHNRGVAGATGQLQFRMIGMEGRVRWMDTHSTPLHDEEGGVEAVLSVTRDISDRYEVEQRLAELRRLNQHILDSVGEGIQGIDRDGRISFANPAAQAMLGLREEEMVGKVAHTLYHHHHPDGRPYDIVDCPIYKTLADGVPRRVDEEVFFHSEGRAFPVEYVVTPGRDSEGRESGVVICFRDISARLADAAARALNDERLRLVAKLTVNAIWDWDLATDEVTWNGGLESLFGYPDAGLDVWASCVHPDDRERVMAFLDAHVRNGPDNWEFEYRFRRRDGRYALVVARGVVVRDGDGHAVRVVGGMSDVTGIRELEDQLRQSQRLEAVGQLTGGMAHDFNNLLTIIMGNAEVLSEQLDSAPELQMLAEMVAHAAQRGAELTSSLLAFARKQALEPGPVDANQMLAGMHVLLRRTLGEHIEIDVVPADGLWTALADQPQLESAVLNLCLNARDAMPTGGRLSIETANVHLDAAYAAQQPDLEAGEYVMVAVSDTGTGIPGDLLGRVCEPFFTTKETGKGTGLGLSMVYGFAKQSHGHLALSSDPGRGTTVRIYLPRIVLAPGVARLPVARGQVRTGQGECILLVEDDSLVRAFARRQVEALGYRAVEAQDGPDALRCLAEHPDVALLFTDVVMSGGMSGRQLADAVHALRPELPVLYTSGYTEDAIVHHGRLDPGVMLLGKPYLRSELAEKLQQAFSRDARV